MLLQGVERSQGSQGSGFDGWMLATKIVPVVARMLTPALVKEATDRYEACRDSHATPCLPPACLTRALSLVRYNAKRKYQMDGSKYEIDGSEAPLAWQGRHITMGSVYYREETWGNKQHHGEHCTAMP